MERKVIKRNIEQLWKMTISEGIHKFSKQKPYSLVKKLNEITDYTPDNLQTQTQYLYSYWLT